MSNSPFSNASPKVTRKYAGFGRRLLAYLVDGGIVIVISSVAETMLGQNPFAFLNGSAQQLHQLQTTTPTLVGLLIAFLYYILYWVNYDGATPGKKLMAIRIIKDDDSKLTYPVAFIRYLGIFLSSFFFGLGYLWVIWDKKKQAWHDKLAGTVVIKTKNKPKTVLAILLSILFISAIFLYTGALIAKRVKEQQRGTKAVVSFRKALDKMSPQAKEYYQQSQALFQQMRANANDANKVRQLNDQNIQILKKALAINPHNPRLWSVLGDAYTWVSSHGSLENGLAAYQKAAALDPNNVLYINNVGDMLNRMGRHDAAVLKFQEALRITNRSAYAHLGLAEAYEALKIYNNAREHYQKALAIFKAENNRGQFDQEILETQKGLARLPQ